MANQRRVPKDALIEASEKEGTDAKVSKIREKRWKEDVREKTEVKAIGQ